jgi:hypothetical protein
MATHWKETGDWYVDAINGDDGNAGTSVAPFKTLNAAATAASNTNKIVVGTGVYNEELNTGASYYYWCADGTAILDATGLSNGSVVFNCARNTFTGFHFINGAVHGLTTTYYRSEYHDCTFTNMSSILQYITYSTYSWNAYVLTFQNCRFQDCDLWTKNGRYIMYCKMDNCVFINSPVAVDADGNNTTSNNLYWDIQNCYFGRSDGKQNPAVLFFRGGFTLATLSNCFFEADSQISSYGIIDNTTKLTGSQYFIDNYSNTISTGANFIVATGSYNTNISGGGTFNTAQGTLQAGNNETIFDNYNQPAFSQFFGNQKPTTAYNWSGSTSNPLHTDGGATWDNIIEENSSLRISSSAAGPTGSIISAVVDLGQPKPIEYIYSSWTATVENACAISVYSSSLLNEYPTRYTYEMRYGDASDLSSLDYKIYTLDEQPFVSSNGSGSGDIGFLTSSYDSISAQYLQFKFTLRTNLTGSI